MLVLAVVPGSVLTGCLDGGEEAQEGTRSPAGDGDDGRTGSAPSEDARDQAPGDGERPHAENEPDPWQGADRLRLLEIEGVVHRESDVACTRGGGPEHQRTENPVAPGTARIEVEVSTGPTWTGLQVGYMIDDPDGLEGREGVIWLEPVQGETRTFEIPVQPDQIEGDGPRLWHFYHRVNPTGDDELCYTGVGIGEWSILIDAVRG